MLAVDRLIASAEETAAMAEKEGGECVPFEADVTQEKTLAAMVAEARRRWGRIDVLHNNVGVSIAGGDRPLLELTEEAFDRVCAINLRGTIMACKQVIPVMREQRSGAIVNVSSVAAYENSYPLVAYKATKAAMIAFTQQLALHNAVLRHPRQCDPSGADGYADGGRHPGARHQSQPRRSRCRARCTRTIARPHGHRVGRR